MALTGKAALVTGGGRGIGKAIACKLAQAGVRVAVTGRTRGQLDSVAHEVGGVAICADFSNRSDVDRCVAEARAALGGVDILVNNAGVGVSAPLDKLTDADWDRSLEVNVTAAFRLCRAVIPLMAAAEWGRVVNVASIAGLVGQAYVAAYCASKHALVGVTRALAIEFARTGVTVNAVCPGWVDTDMAASAIDTIVATTKRTHEQARVALESMNPQRRFIKPEEVAHMVEALCRDDAVGINGQAIPIDGGQVLK